MRININYLDGQPGLVAHLEDVDKTHRATRLKFYAELGYVVSTDGAKDMALSRLRGLMEDLQAELGVPPIRDINDEDSHQDPVPAEEEGLFLLDTESLVMGSSG